LVRVQDWSGGKLWSSQAEGPDIILAILPAVPLSRRRASAQVKASPADVLRFALALKRGADVADGQQAHADQL
jgi:hypothetical protein